MQRAIPSSTPCFTQAELDIAIICTWGAFHAETGIQICDSGRVKAVLCEKPFTQNAAEAAAFAEASRKNRVLVAEAFKFRHHPMHLRAKAMLDAGEIGDLVGVRSTFCTSSGALAPRAHARVELALQQGQRWRQYLRLGLLQTFTMRGSYLARSRSGCLPRNSWAWRPMMPRRLCSSFLGAALRRSPWVLIRSVRSTRKFPGTAGCLRLDQVWNNENRAVTIEHRTPSGAEVIEIPPCFQFALQLQHLCECLAEGREHRITPEHSVAQNAGVGRGEGVYGDGGERWNCNPQMDADRRRIGCTRRL